MSSVQPNPELIDDENPEWTEEVLSEAVRVGDLPRSLRTKLQSKASRSITAQTKVATTIPFDEDVLAFFKASGKDWQTRINEVLRNYVASH